MLIDLKKAVAKHRMQINGVIHVGAHFGQEYQIYRELGISPILFIEPCDKAFKALQETFKECPEVTLFQSACGSEFSIGTMNVEQANQGMSNSLLKPAKHLEQYPSIKFTTTEEVEVRKLDEIVEHLGFSGNLLVMDVQGFELQVLKGAPETLKGIDYILLELNRDEVYHNCAKVWEIDAFLQEFTRVETNWAGGSWGDGLYIKTNLHV
jgi:FkbM family methyltransferase